jgi:hypothetical protein
LQRRRRACDRIGHHSGDAHRFRLYHGNDLEVLAGLLAAELARPVPGARCWRRTRC